MKELTKNFQNKDWFHSSNKDQFGRYVVYVNKMTPEVLDLVPSTFENKQVLTHFASSLLDSSHFVGHTTISKVKPEDIAEEESMEDIVWSLRRECGTDNLMDILYEIHEETTGKANMHLTNMSKEFPEVRKELEPLYEEFGFDVLYEEIDLE